MVPTTMERALDARRRDETADRPVRLWLYLVAALIFAMVIVGGVTRLTESGLSITEWQPLLGALPPLSDADWQAAFDRYREIPQYRLMNAGMSLEEFRSIYWWEWSHRLLGRAIGVVFAVPLIVFWATGRIPRARLARLSALFVLGGLQGAIGWWMVSSGLADRVDVAPLRLAVHLTFAAMIYAAVLWTALTLSSRGRSPRPSPVRRIGAAAVLGWIFLQIFLGALVSGNHAGLVYDTWPLMNGDLMPPDVFAMSPLWTDLVENPATVQFLHRMSAYVLLALVMVQFVTIVVTARTATARVSAFVLGFAVVFQIMVGISTLLMHVPFALALIHQATAMGVLTAAVIHAVSVFAPGRMETTLLHHEG
ncbi:MAG: COX15/CtaA family protein [Hyphomicrobiales bacterium]|nr:COX15/CtaA family protein [Hyphomicrobiales bacterium]